MQSLCPPRRSAACPELKTASLRRPANATHRAGGVVLVILLLAIILFTAMIFYVWNIGRNTQNRIVTQNSADATVQAGGGWVARSFNTVAMNNVGIARLISGVNVLDSVPLASQFALKDGTAFFDATDAQLRRGVPLWWVEDALIEMHEDLDRERVQLEEVNQLFNLSGYDVADMTFFNGPNGQGQMWRAMYALDAYSTATMENLGLLSQMAAARGGQVNMRPSDPNADAILLPGEPLIPFERGEFDDFERPVRQGLLPEDVDDEVTNRGPFDAVFGWRIPNWETEGYWTGGGSTTSRGDSGWSRGGNNRRGSFVVTRRDVTAYRTYGTQSHQLRVVNARDNSAVPFSRFGRYVSDMANIKLSYLWPGGPIRQLVDPNWITDYTRAQSEAEANPNLVYETAYTRLVFERLESDGMDFAILTERDIIRARRWVPEPPGLNNSHKLSNHVWHDELVVEFPDPDGGEPIRFIYDNYFIFLGANIGEPVDIRNPHNFADRSTLPAPTDFDHNQMLPDDATRRQFLTFLGIARHSNSAMMWPTAFDRRQPFDNMVAIAQGHVFNNHSWDLWTQMWHHQLEPVADYSGWVETLDATGGAAADVPYAMSPDEISDLSRYLRSIEPMAETLLRH